MWLRNWELVQMKNIGKYIADCRLQLAADHEPNYELLPLARGAFSLDQEPKIPIKALVGLKEFDGHEGLDSEFNGDDIFHVVENQLTGIQESKIAVGAARGLEYLHSKMKPFIIYEDLKCSNILLGEGYHSKLSDFGLAKVGSSEAEQQQSKHALTPLENVILIRWNLRGVPQVPWEAKGEFQGTSRYKLDRNGKIYEHKVDNLAFNFPQILKPILVFDLVTACPASPNLTFSWGPLDSNSSSWLEFYQAVKDTVDQEERIEECIYIARDAEECKFPILILEEMKAEEAKLEDCAGPKCWETIVSDLEALTEGEEWGPSIEDEEEGLELRGG
ncbi:hypothetical protein JHK85_012556 [Glycine max]|nr:hypothetical protein JHK85_012556 [Glycine max]